MECKVWAWGPRGDSSTSGWWWGAHLPLQSSQRAKEQCGASLCMRVAVSRVTTSCTPRTAWGKGTRWTMLARRSQAPSQERSLFIEKPGKRPGSGGILGKGLGCAQIQPWETSVECRQPQPFSRPGIPHPQSALAAWWEGGESGLIYLSPFSLVEMEYFLFCFIYYSSPPQGAPLPPPSGLPAMHPRCLCASSP